jgi:hypothetical protein
MTSNPPPGPPPGEPGPGQQPGGYQPPPPDYGQQGPPQGQQYGQQSQQYGAPQQYGQPQHYGQYGGPQAQHSSPAKKSFDFNSVDKLDWGIMGAGVLALIFSLFEYYTASAKGQLKQACDQGVLSGDSCSGSESAWHGFFGWFGVLLLLAAAAITALVVFAPQVKVPFPARLVALGAAVLGLLFTFIALFVTPEPSVPGGLPPGTSLDDFIDFGRGFSYWIILILALAATALAFLRFQQTGGDLAAVFSGGAKKQSTGTYGPPQNAPAPQGYQQQAPSGYQSPPAYEQSGYQPQPPPGGYQPPASYQPPPPQQPGYQPPTQGGQPQGQQPPPGYQPPPPGSQPPPSQGEQPPPPQQPPAQG